MSPLCLGSYQPTWCTHARTHTHKHTQTHTSTREIIITFSNAMFQITIFHCTANDNLMTRLKTSFKEILCISLCFLGVCECVCAETCIIRCKTHIHTRTQMSCWFKVRVTALLWSCANQARCIMRTSHIVYIIMSLLLLLLLLLLLFCWCKLREENSRCWSLSPTCDVLLFNSRLMVG